MSVGTVSIPRFGVPLTPPGPRVVSEWLSTYDHEHWPDPPEGDGRPVMLVPGFMAGDQTLTRMAVWLRTGGFQLARSGIEWNTRCMEPTVIDLEQRLEQAVEWTGKRALLVGQSRGGTIGRALATLRPDLIGALVALGARLGGRSRGGTGGRALAPRRLFLGGSLVTLGSPLLDQLAVKPRIWPTIL